MSGGDRPTPAGVRVVDLATAVRDAPGLVEPHLGSMVPLASGEPLAGVFVHVAAGIEVVTPLQTFFGRDIERMAPVSRTLIVAEAGASVAYIEGCSAPIYTPHTERSSVVEVVVGPGARVRHTSIQNWSANVRNVVGKQARVAERGRVEWVDAAFGSRSTRGRCATYLAGVGASASALSMISAHDGQHHDVENAMFHEVEDTSSAMTTTLIGSGTGVISSQHVVRGADERSCRATARGLRLDGEPMLDHHTLDGTSASGTAPSWRAADIDPAHLRYLMRRGLSRSQAIAMVVLGLIEPITRSLPLEYAIEWERLIELHLDQVVG